MDRHGLVPPHDSDAELAVISSIMFEPMAFEDAHELLVADDFYRHDYKACYTAMVELHTVGKPIDLITLKNRLEERGEYEQIGGRDLLASVATSSSTSANIAHYAKIVVDKASRRKLINLAKNIETASVDNTIDVFKIKQAIAKHESELNTTTGLSEQLKVSAAALDKFVVELDQPQKSMQTGFSSLDTLTGGIRVPSLTTIGANASTGKTAFVLNIAMHQKPDVPVIVFSLEMSSNMIYERIFSFMKDIDYSAFSTRIFTNDQRNKINQSIAELKARNIHVFDDVYDIETQTAIIGKIKPKMVIVDYAQIANTTQKKANRREEVEYIANEYKVTAKKHNCAILLLSQINRTERGNPTMGALRETGVYEHVSDYVLMLHRPFVLKKDDPDVCPEEAYVLVDKNKFGKTGKKDLYFEGKYQKFTEYDWQKEKSGFKKYGGTPYNGTTPFD